MEVAAVAVQQSMLQLNASIAMVKQAANVQKSIVEMVAAAAQSSRGGNLNISV